MKYNLIILFILKNAKNMVISLKFRGGLRSFDSSFSLISAELKFDSARLSKVRICLKCDLAGPESVFVH